MGRAAILGALLTLISCEVAAPQTSLEDAHPLACASPEETRELYLSHKLAQPFRVMREAAAAIHAEAIAIQLCWFSGALVYDVTLLQGDGRVTHRLINAKTGAALPGRPPP